MVYTMVHSEGGIYHFWSGIYHDATFQMSSAAEPRRHRQSLPVQLSGLRQAERIMMPSCAPLSTGAPGPPSLREIRAPLPRRATARCRVAPPRSGLHANVVEVLDRRESQSVPLLPKPPSPI